MESLGELVKEWRSRSGLTTTQLAGRVRKFALTEHGRNVKRQHIEQLEKAGSRQPRYFADLARAMNTTMDALTALRMPQPLDPLGKRTPGPIIAALPRDAAAPPPRPDFNAREFTETDWATLEAVKLFVPEAQLADYRRRAAEFEQDVRSKVLADLAAAAPPPAADKTHAGTVGTTLVQSPHAKNKAKGPAKEVAKK